MDRGAWRATVPGAAHTHFHQQKREIKFRMEKQPEHFWKPFSALHTGESALYGKRDTGFRCPSGGGGRREAPEGPRDWNPKAKHLSSDSSRAPGEASWLMFFPDYNNHVLHIRPKNRASGRQNHHGGCQTGMGPTHVPPGCPAGRNVLVSKIQSPSGPVWPEEGGKKACDFLSKHHSNRLTGTELNLDFRWKGSSSRNGVSWGSPRQTLCDSGGHAMFQKNTHPTLIFLLRRRWKASFYSQDGSRPLSASHTASKSVATCPPTLGKYGLIVWTGQTLKSHWNPPIFPYSNTHRNELIWLSQFKKILI